jgi:hypothetical protein
VSYLRRVEAARKASAGARARRAALLLLLCGLALATVSDVIGSTDHRWANEPAATSDDEGPPGRWRKAREGASQPELTDEQRAEIERLRSIGYLSGSSPAPSTTGVTVHDRRRAFQGYNFFTSGHFAGALLMDMDGNVLHEWTYDFLEAWPQETESAENDGAEYWRWAYLFENGDVLAIFEGLGMLKVDRHSRLLWKRLEGEHHDLEVTDDGHIYVLTREAHLIPRINEHLPILEDFITVLDPDGNLVREFSILEAFEKSPFASAPEARKVPKKGDIYHTNAIEVLDGSLADRIPAFAKGNVLISMRQTSMLAVVDMSLEEVVWVASDLWLEQHDPKVLANGNILLFDNNGGNVERFMRGRGGESRVLEFDPVTQEVDWSYAGSSSEAFYTKMCGATHRLANGNTMASESDFGRAFEVTPDGDVVWEYVSPHRAGKRNNLIATLFDMTRLPPDFPLDWLD